MATLVEIAERNNRAVILIGAGARKFRDFGLLLTKHLIEDARFDARNVDMIESRYYDQDEILEKIENHVDESNRYGPDNLILSYAGHGFRGGISPKTDTYIEYEIIGNILKRHKGIFFFINSSCYSGKCIPVFEKIGLLPRKGLVISSCDEEQFDYFGLVRNLLACYRKCRPFPQRFTTNKIFNGLRVGMDEVYSQTKEHKFRDLTTSVRYIFNNFEEELGSVEKVVTVTQRKGRRIDFLLYPKYR